MSPGKPMRAMIEAAGGLATSADLARHWGVTRQRAAQICSAPDFPEAVTVVSGRAVYAVCEADEYRQAVRQPGRPRKAAA